jgi:hypothetical protein
VKQIQKLIKTIKSSEFISEKREKIEDTNRYLYNNRRRYVADTPAGFKSRSGSDFFLQ